MTKKTMPIDNISKIIGIQFSILSPEEIIKGSVAEITTKETYIGNKPVIGGIFDPRMGVIDSDLICPTDGLDNIKTPGYFGHIKLAKPVFYIQYLNTVMKIIKCICFKCSKLLLSKDKHKHIMNLPNDIRWKYVFPIASKIKRCGEDTEEGCGCLQPTKIRKEGISSIFAEWKNESQNNEEEKSENIVIKITPEMFIKIFKRITDEDISFMGFSPIWSRPEWMICQVLAVPPPAVRPSVKHDSQQRSEDDLSHALINIVKTNKSLLEKLQNNAPGNLIDDWTTVLQYYIACMVDNKIPGAVPVSQRSGRPLKSIKDRLNGKGGRMRGNLMAKRVDFSARSVITADPNISIRELGIPMKIAKNITKPVLVNKYNKAYLMKLVQNGPEVYPGAKILEKKNGDSITLRYIDRNSIILEDGDIVHRHTLNGDPVIFNRQPTLHRMSMQCHVAKVMEIGDTFRLNVAVTKPYNADFDGDEMNLHMPQDIESDAELLNLAAVPFNIISPANNSPIIGIFQDSMLGSYLFTRNNIYLNKMKTMNLLMSFNNVNENILNNNNDMVSSFEILSQILPPFSLKTKNKNYNDNEDYKTTNNIIEIKNGQYIRGQIDKGILGSGSKGIINRICNDYGNYAVSDFIDNLQNIITDYMLIHGYSVGISDLYSDNYTKGLIIEAITDKKNKVKNIIDETHLGIFENKTGKTNEEEFETRVNNILNQATSEAGKIGLKSLNENNRFVIMVNAGSKGSDLNIAQMTSCLGQQNVDGKRIPYGFEHRTLPHYTKYDDSPNARGFVENSYINGLEPQELFFHAMGGRVGLIDTAVKTSTTGYIQRRLIKGLEDLMVRYDGTVRTSKDYIVQFLYGDDNIDTIKVENQELNLVNMSIQDIYNHYGLLEENMKSKILSSIFTKPTITRHKKQFVEINDKNKKYIDMMIYSRDDIVKNIFKYKDDKMVKCPVSFHHIINNIIGQQNINTNSLVDITLLEAYNMIEYNYTSLEKLYYYVPTELFKVLYYFYLSPKQLLYVKRFNRSALTLLLQTINLNYKKSIVSPGEMVGMIAGQSIGEISTQLTLNTFHSAGISSKSNVTRGVPRIDEILTVSANPKNPSLTIFLKPEDETNKETATNLMYMIEHTKLKETVESIEICFDPDDLNTLIDEDKNTIECYREFEKIIGECLETEIINNNEKSKWIIRMVMDRELMLEKNITMDDINFTLKNSYNDLVECIYSDYNADKLIFRIRMNNILKHSKTQKKIKTNPLDQSDQIYILKNFQDQLLENVILRGVKGINKVILRKVKDTIKEKDGIYKKQEIWVLDTIGSNLMEVLGLSFIDFARTYSNDIVEIYNVLGIEAARQTIFNELTEVLEFDGTYINYHHICILVDRMCFTNKIISIFRHGLNNDDTGVIARASFEEVPEQFLKGARHGELDIMKGVSANVMVANEGYYGTSSFQVVLDMNKMLSLEASKEYETINEEGEINRLFSIKEYPNDYCSIDNLKIDNGVINIKTKHLGDEDDDYKPLG